MGDLPKISVIMSVYNSESTIGKAIDTILNQTESNFEFLICNDGSTDRTGEILKKFAFGDSRIMFFDDSENLGLTVRLNQLLKQSRGKWIARMDSDDESYPNRFQRQIEKIESNPNAVLVCGTVDVVNHKNETISRVSITQEKLNRIDQRNCITHGSVFMRKSAIDTIGGYDDRIQYAQDYDLYLRLLKQGEFVFVDEPIYRLRISQNIVSHQKMFLQLHFVSWIQAKAHAYQKNVFLARMSYP